MTEQFENVTVIKKANVYFGGKVTSRTVLFPDGSRKTLGFMQPGEYEFNTAAREVMEILNGSMDVLLPDKTEWQTFKAGDTFEVPPNSSFKLKLQEAVDYCCSYVA
ncbi:MAG: pyrimidine/purine nucleoside phosphorylase [Anaerolineales bacterium]